MSNDKLQDAAGRTENPYEQKMLLVAAPLRKSVPDGRATFIVPSNLVMNNTGAFTLQVDFGNGAGYNTVNVNTPITINYTTAGTKNLVFKLTQNGVNYFAKSTFEVKNVFSFNNSFGKNCPGICFDALWSDVNFGTGNPITTAEAYIIYANGRSNLQRPLIFVEGQDVQDEYNFRDLYLALNNAQPDNPNAPLNQLIANGFDVIILNFRRTGGQSMRTNAEVLRRLINWVNQQKQGTNQLVLGGISMGGVVARYTLAKMENDYCENHNVEKYFSIDAPHTGANIPLGLQILTANASALSLGLSVDLASASNQLTAISTQELLSIYSYSNGTKSPASSSFYNELNHLGMPQRCRNVAWSNGNTFNNIPQFGSISFNQGDQILSYHKTGDVTVDMDVFAVNTASTQNTLNLFVNIHKEIANFPQWMNNIGINDIIFDWTPINSQFPYQSIKQYDNSPGGYILTQEEVSNSLDGSTTFGRNHHCIVPSMSAYGVETNNLIFNQNFESIEATRLSPFDEVYSSSNMINYSHLILPPNLGTQIGLEIFINNPAENSFLNITNETYNMSSNSYMKQIPNTNINTGGILRINAAVASNFGSGALPIQASTFSTTMNNCATTLNVNSGGLLQIGGGTTYGIVTVSTGKSIRINNGGSLDIRWGSKLILEGGSLIVEQGANINLQDLESVVEIRDGGKIVIGNNATFTWTGAGYLKFNTSYGNYTSSVVASSGGNGASFRHRVSALPGSGFNRKAIEVTSGSISIDENLGQFSLIGGTVLMGSNTIADIACPMYLGGVKIKSINPGEKHGGIFVYGQQNTAYLSGCAIDDAIIGIRIFATRGSATVSTIYNSNFNNCDIGVLVYGKSTNINGGSYFGNKTGIYLSGNQSESVISNINAWGNRSAIDVVGSGTDVVRVEKSNISNNSAVGGFIVNSKIRPLCSVFNNNYPSSNGLNGANILLREFAYLDAEPFGAKNAGKSSLTSDNGHAVVCVGASGIELNNGYCDYSTPNSAGLAFNGEMQGWYLNNPRQMVQANNNRWNSAGTSPINLVDYNLDYFWAFGDIQASLLINGSNPLTVSTNISGNCGSSQTGWGNWDNGDKPSALLNKPTRILQDGSFLDTRFKNGLMKMYATTPNYPGVIQDLLPILTEPYSSSSTSPDDQSDLSKWFPAIELAYRTSMEALGNGIANGSIINESDNPTGLVQEVIDAQQGLISYVTETYTAQDKVFQLSLDHALLYRLIHNLPLAHEKVMALNGIAINESQTALINYYDCLISNEMLFSNQYNPASALASTTLCRTYMNMDEGEIEPFGDRPEDPIWEEGMGKTAANESIKPTTNVKSSSEVTKTLVSAIKLHPNPASQELTIAMPSELNINKLIITDMIGRIVHAVVIDKYESKITLPIDWENGTYLITFLSSENIISRQKVVVSK
ncbi:MAG: T9SS type A sorting domain-containing protein [Bacteroidia bacterium]|nr:T9SS type A sorting domain-containing protein [Bacteroidia bacterium]